MREWYKPVLSVFNSLSNVFGDPAPLLRRISRTYREAEQKAAWYERNLRTALKYQNQREREQGEQIELREGKIANLEETIARQAEIHQDDLAQQAREIEARMTEEFSNRLREINAETLAEVQRAQKQENAARMAFGQIKDQYKELVNGRVIVPFMKIYETTNPQFANSIGVYLDRNGAPVYATPAFLNMTNMRAEDLKTTDVSKIHQAIKQKDTSRISSSKIQLEVGKRTYELIQRRYTLKDDENGEVGTFVQLTQVQPGLFEILRKKSTREKRRGEHGTIRNLVEIITKAMKNEKTTAEII